MAIKDTTLPVGGGPDGKSPVFIPKGMLVNYHVYTTHHQQEYWGADVEEFVPERWETARPTWEYLPFHGGPRACLGQQYALTEGAYTIVRLMQKFSKVEARDDQPWTESLKLAVGNLHGTKVVMTPM